MSKFLSALLAAAVALTAIAPAPAFADHRRDGYYDHRDRDRYDHRRRHRDHDDDDAVAAGVIGLVLGLAVGAAVADSNRRRYGEGQCYDNYQRCAPPEGYYRDDYYDDRGGYYEDDRCLRTERVWDRRAQRYVTVEIPC